MEKCKSIEAINQRIQRGDALVLTAEEMIDFVREEGEDDAFSAVDVVTTATFGAMCSSGAFMNFGHTDPPMRMGQIWLNDVPAYGGLASVDCYLGATQPSEKEGNAYGGAHVIEELLGGQQIHLRALSAGTDCYPRKEFETLISLADLNQAYLFNPRNCYQNYAVAVNSSNRAIHTYMGTLLPRCGNASFSSAGQLSPLLNDPQLKTIGIGTRIFLGGAQGYVSWEGTQFNTVVSESDFGVPDGPARTIAVIGDLKQMRPEYIRAASLEGYGVTLYVGIGIPIPIVSRDMVRSTAISDAQITAPIIDYSVPKRSRPILGRVTYEQLRSGNIVLDDGTEVCAAPLSSYRKARQIAQELQKQLRAGEFELSTPAAALPKDGSVSPLNSHKGVAIDD